MYVNFPYWLWVKFSVVSVAHPSQPYAVPVLSSQEYSGNETVGASALTRPKKFLAVLAGYEDKN